MTLRAEGEGFCPHHIFGFEGAVKMREICAAAGGLPFQIIAQPVCLYGQKEQALNTSEILRAGFFYLISSGQVNIAIGQINRRAEGGPFGGEFGLLIGPEYFIDNHVIDRASFGFRFSLSCSSFFAAKNLNSYGAEL